MDQDRPRTNRRQHCADRRQHRTIGASNVQIAASIVRSCARAQPIGIGSHFDGGRKVLTPARICSIAGSRDLNGGSFYFNLISLRCLCGTGHWIRGTGHFVITVTTPTALNYNAECSDTVQIDGDELHAAGTFDSERDTPGA